MRHLVLGIGYHSAEYDITRNEWRQYGIEFDFADDFQQAVRKLTDKNYACISLCSDTLPHDDIDALCKVWSIPILMIPPEYNMAQQYKYVRHNVAQYIHFASRPALTRASGDMPHSCLDIPGGEWKPLTLITTKDLCFCLEHHTVEVRGQPIELTAKEFALLTLLISSPKMVFTYAMLFEKVWKEEYTVASKKTLNNHMSNLRRKLKITPDVPDYIINIHSVGYKYNLS